MIAIETIRFNHNTASAGSDGLNIRKNATRFITVPEWKRFTSVNPEDSPAAYAVAAAKEKAVTVEVTLSCTDPGLAFAEVRAAHHVKARPVNFTNGSTGPVSFELIDPPVSHGRVGIWDQEWHWEWRRDPHLRWRRFATTRHRIYVVLDVPTAPWNQAPYNAANTQLPWTEVLD